MFICKKCASERNIPNRWDIAGKSSGPCEFCGITTICADIKSTSIPIKQLTVEDIFRQVYPTHQLQSHIIQGDIQQSLIMYSHLGKQLIMTRIDRVGKAYFFAQAYEQEELYLALPMELSKANELANLCEQHEIFKQ